MPLANARYSPNLHGPAGDMRLWRTYRDNTNVLEVDSKTQKS